MPHEFGLDHLRAPSKKLQLRAVPEGQSGREVQLPDARHAKAATASGAAATTAQGREQADQAAEDHRRMKSAVQAYNRATFPEDRLRCSCCLKRMKTRRGDLWYP